MTRDSVWFWIWWKTCLLFSALSHNQTDYCVRRSDSSFTECCVCVCVFLAPEHETSRCSALMSRSCLFGSGSSHSCWSEHIRLLFMFTQDEWDRCVLFCITVLLTNVCRVDESDWMLVLGADTDVIQLPDIGLMPPFHVQNPKLRLLHTKSVFLSTKIVACLKVNTTSCCQSCLLRVFRIVFLMCMCCACVFLA